MDEVEVLFATLFERYPLLAGCRASVREAFELLASCYRAGGKLLVAGNGGSAADADHIVGELMKGFRLKRPLPDDVQEKLAKREPQWGPLLAGGLQRALPAIALTNHLSLTSAFANDVDPTLGFAQQLSGYARPGDVLLAISTSGMARNLIAAALAAPVFGVRGIALTGASGGRLAALCDVAIRVPESDTSRIQELHLPVYHTLCAMLELTFFGEATPPSAAGL